MRTWLVSLAIALPLFAQSEAEFRGLFDAYNRALRGELYDATMAVLTEEQIHLYAEVPRSQRQMFFGMTYRIPLSYQVEYLKVSKDRLKATMRILCTFATPDKGEMILGFVKQKNLWRMERPVYGGDPEKRARPSDLAMGSHTDYSEAAADKLRGTVLRLSKQDDGTVYVILNGDEEDAVFVPTAQVSADFVPGAVMSFRAVKHKSEKMKYRAESASLAE